MTLTITTTTEQIWTEFSDSLKQFIIRRVSTESDAEDILQNVFIKIYRNIHTLKADAKLQAWVSQITRNAITDYYRQRNIVVELPDTLAEPTNETAANETAPGEITACLKPMVDSLPEKYRQAIVLTEFEGMSQKAMSENMGLSFSGAKSRVQRGRQQLQAMLLQCCHIEFDRRGNVVDHQSREQACAYCGDDELP